MAFKKSFLRLVTLLELLNLSSSDRNIVCAPQDDFTAVKLEQVRDLLRPQMKP